jgi:hypothetical protein
MKLTLVDEAKCPNGRTCPNINTSDRGTVVIQGYIVQPASCPVGDLRESETVVEIPVELLPPGLVSPDTRLYRTAHGTLLVVGRRVTDDEALDELQVPAGEDAVEVAAAHGRMPAHAE